MSKQNKQIKTSVFSMTILSLISSIIGIIGIILFVMGFLNQSNQGIAMAGMMFSIIISFIAIADLFGCIIVIIEEKKNTDVRNYTLYIMATLKDSVFSNIMFLIISSIILIVLIIIFLIL